MERERYKQMILIEIETIVTRALRDTNIPKLVAADVPRDWKSLQWMIFWHSMQSTWSLCAVSIFSRLIDDLFMGVNVCFMLSSESCL